MPNLLKEDWMYPLPQMHNVQQIFRRDSLTDVSGEIIRQMKQDDIQKSIHPGARVAVAVGSRGIRNLNLIVRGVLDEIKAAGGVPFIVSAMGSHGNGTSEGQREVLSGYGITEASMGVEIITEMDVEYIGQTSRGIHVYFDKVALSADMIVPINRIKLHTDFVADIQSGLCKMLVIGLGNHKGCSAIHEENFDFFGNTLLEAGEMIMQRVNVGFGVGIVENAYDETALVEVIPADKMIAREKELVQIAKGNMPTLMIPEIDVLIVEEIGKNISGAGYDPNILGKSYLLKEFVLAVPRISRMVLLDITAQSHGNAIGMGAFDVTTKALFEKLNLEPIYANAIAVKCPEDAKIPIIADSEEEAIRIAIKVARGADLKKLKVVRIKNTLELDTIQISDALLPEIDKNKQLEYLSKV